MHIPLNSITYNHEEIDAAIAVLKGGQLTMGPLCEKFEIEFAQYVGSRHAVFVNSGSSANLLVFFALANQAFKPQGKSRALKPGTEVLVPAVTWSTTVWPVVQAGGVPVLVDCDPLTLQMNMSQALRATKAETAGMCVVHVLGNTVDLEAAQAVCAEKNLWLIEDTCEALGSKFASRFVGTAGLAGTYSFYFSHHITTIEGGMIVTDDDELAELLRVLRAHGWTRHLKNRAAVEAKHPEVDPRFLFINTGFNVRPTEINAAFGLQQLKKLSQFNKRRQEIARHWCDKLSAHIESGQITPMRPTELADCTWFGFPVLCQTPALRQKLQQHLEKNHIETRPIICGNLARQPAFKTIKHRVAGSLSGADKVHDCGLFWGSHPMMSDAEVDYVVDVVKKCLK